MLSVDNGLSYNAKKALEKGIIFGIITTLIYLIVVIVTTPALQPITAIIAAFKMNSVVILGLSAGIGAQVFLSSYSSSLGCRIDKKKKGVFAGSGGSSAISSFFSFFSLVQLGCCGTWLMILSFLPSIFGSTFSVILIEYSSLLSNLGLAIVYGFIAISIIKLRHEVKQKGIQSIENSDTTGAQKTKKSYPRQGES